jgi:CheY-like chemotaxis protein
VHLARLGRTVEVRNLFQKEDSIRIAIIDDNSEMLRCLRVTLNKLAKRLGMSKPDILPLMDPTWVEKHYRKNPFPDVVLCDYMMPQMDGVQVYHKLKEMGYKGQFIFVTGAEEAIMRDHADFDVEETKVVSKPYDLEDFEEILRHG